MMLYQEIRQRCRMYHALDERGYDGSYARYIEYRTQTQDKWDNPDRLGFGDAEELITFLNKWGCKIPFHDAPTPQKVDLDLLLNNMKTGAPLLGASTIRVATMNQLLNNLKSTVPLLNTLRSATLLDVHFDENRRRMLTDCFNAIAKFGIKKGAVSNEAVATSKLLHVAINPNLFVMWDGEIQPAYILQKNWINTGFGYAEVFLQKIQRIARRAVNEVMAEENLSRADAIQSFTDHCEKKNSLAKIIDEYNYTKYTKKWHVSHVAKSSG